MSMSISVSGINAAQKHLDVTSNNIANVNTIGFKNSRAEFADMYANSIFTDNRTAVGNGVQTACVSQQFSQGSLTTTKNALDLSIMCLLPGYFRTISAHRPLRFCGSDSFSAGI